ncbi:MAG: glycosyltransferase family 2 protein [Actinobacteria bacterium]|nr:glycosyltransferase family 2 protein [Actinomycetota bacterium]
MPEGPADGGRTPVVSIVVPVFNEEEGLPELQRRVDEALGAVEGGVEVVYVDDGSADGSAALLEALARERDDVVLVRLSRNFGMEIAMSAGMDHARGDYVALLHADLQDPPELITEMLVRARNGADVVYARRIGRDESLLKRTLATAFYRLMERLARTPYQGQAGDFRLMSRRTVEALRTMPERRRFLRGMVAWVGFEQVPVEYRRAGRQSGRGASYPALFRLAFEALASFSDVPLRLASWLGVTLSALSALLAAVVLLLTATGVVVASSATWILIAVLFLGGAQLVSAGIIGRYLARVHEQSLGRPLYLVDRVVARAPAPASSLSASVGQAAAARRA